MLLLEVGTIVDSILSAFGNAADVFKHIRSNGRSKKVKKPSFSAEERQLQDSLTNGPLSIRSQYDRNVAMHGKYFVVGDTSAQTSLARTLFNLNNGLVDMISSMLDKNSKRTIGTKQSLLSLSQKATIDTLHALGALDERLSTRQLTISCPSKPSKGRKTQKNIGREEQQLARISDLMASSEPNPILIRGGWIRTKSGDSIIVTAEEARRRAAQKMNKKRVRAVKTGTSHQKEFSKRKEPAKNAANNLSNVQQSQVQSRSQQVTTIPTGIENMTQAVCSGISVYDQQRPPSLYIVPADAFRPQNIANDQLPPRPPKIPLHTRPDMIPRSRPVSGITFMTASTKMGEIPENRIPDISLTEEELQNRPLPYAIPLPLIQPPPKRRKGFWRFKLKG